MSKYYYKVDGGCVLCLCCIYGCPVRAIRVEEDVSAVIDPDKCIGCGMCARGCPAGCIAATDYVAEGHKRPSMKIDTAACVKCGACISTCKFNAIEKR